MKQFELTDLLADEIIFAMENQNGDYLLNPETSSVFILGAEDEEFDTDECYSLPEWSSGDGYELMEQFTQDLRNPVVKRELRQVLTGGRGVFRNFKNILSNHPEVEKLWFTFKNNMMRQKVNQWYNELRECWGLEAIEFQELDSEETGDLVDTDFEFSEYSSQNRDEIIRLTTLIAEEYKKERFGSFICNEIKSQTDLINGGAQGFICRNNDGEITGCVLFSAKNIKEKTVEVVDFFVTENYRGLGIGKQLLSRCQTYLSESGVQWITFSKIFISRSLECLLLDNQFEKTGSIFIKDLKNA